MTPGTRPLQLPPPPPGYTACAHRSGDAQMHLQRPPPPPDPSQMHPQMPPPPPNPSQMHPQVPLPPAKSLSPVPEGSEHSGFMFPSPAHSDFDPDATAAKDTGRATFAGGCPGLLLIFPQNASSTLVARSGTQAACGGNFWNLYQCFARLPRRLPTEYGRIHPEFDPATMPLPQLTASDLHDMYKGFQDFYADDWETILEEWGQVAHLENGDTLASHQRYFDRVCKGLRASINAAHEKHFEAILFICGSCIHEDAELANVIGTPALQTAFAETLKHHGSGLPLSNSDLLGIVKMAAYGAQLQRFVEAGLSLPDTLPATSDGSNPTKSSGKASEKASGKASARALPVILANPSPAPAVPANPSAPVGALHPSTHPSGIVSTAVAGPSTAAAAPFTKIQTTTTNFNAIRDRNFLWVPLGTLLSRQNLRLVGFPTAVRLPGEIYSNKGTGSWRVQDLTHLNVALLEYESGSGWGIRLEHHNYSEGDLVIIGHDYSVAAPADPAAAPLHWQTSGSKAVRCQDASGDVWSAHVDLCSAGDAAITKTILTRRAKEEPVVKVDEDEEDEEDEEEDEEEEEEVPVGAKGKGKGRSKSKPAPAKKTKRKAAPPADTSDFFEEDDDVLEEEEPTLPPRRTQKLRSQGAPTPTPPPRTTQAKQQGSGKPANITNRKPAPQKQVSFAPPTSDLPPANDPATIAARRKIVQSLPKPGDGGRDFLVPKASATTSARLTGSHGAPPEPSGSGSVSASYSLPPNPPAHHQQPMAPPPSPPPPTVDPLQAAMAELAHVPRQQLATALLQLLQGAMAGE
ncbi:hypothetical protein DFH07DRAFT_1059051 [Mycena maculata]|uniref:Uncharacterized protein n=1 Tax=Mycena maculata TaxID=230809 RepID=A0AAD7NKB2_9AGAR|nr:hypothetical protein DFH07DRAFT_1059051 [Mycena maculata]